MNVVVADIQEDLGAKTAEEVAGHGVRAEFLPVNVADHAAMMALADTVFDRYGEVHLLCNNAGVLDVGWTTETTLEDWEWLLSVNLWGVINGLLAFLPRMAEQSGECHILNVGSPTCFVPVVGMAPYNAAKHAVAGLTQTLRAELADTDIGVTLFCPAETDTNIGPNSVKLRQQLLGTTRERPPELAAALAARRTDLKEAQQDAMQVARVALRAVAGRRTPGLQPPDASPDRGRPAPLRRHHVCVPAAGRPRDERTVRQVPSSWLVWYARVHQVL